MDRRVRVAVRVGGVVQGVGFRPFAHGLARRLRLSGFVGNDAAGVFAEVEGPSADVDAFVLALREEAPPLAVVDDVRVTPMAVADDVQPVFSIVDSPAGGQVSTLVSADSATCADCLAELRDPGDRRYRYPFINCTNCGPRFTIVRGVPYDRPFTTMAGFPMCAGCRREYEDPGDRRFHAQPVCCPVCGPKLWFHEERREPDGTTPLKSTVDALRAGAVVAIKGLGGYHLAVDAESESAVAALRGRKHREDKPFAIMVPDLAAARKVVAPGEIGERLLTSRRSPIVLLPRVANGPLATAVAPRNRKIGVLLPYTPLHHLLLGDFGGSIVLTSANVSDEPIVYRDEDALNRLKTIADAFLTHDRAIHTRTDDSVVRPVRGRVQLQRRSRGYAPEPVTLHRKVPRHVLGCGAELKNTFCLAKDDHAFVSHHIGDLENYETLKSYTEGIRHWRELFDVTPAVVAHDLHPEYLSTKYALDLEGVEHVGVQHHHAHIASCLADNGEDGPVLGVAFDGTGYGTDGTIWGGEFLLADLAGFERVGHLQTVPMPGGAAAVREPWRMAAAHLDAAGITAEDLKTRHEEHWDDVVKMARSGLNSPLTSSAGRLFDAVAALLGVRDCVNYEGQAAVELEQLADPEERGTYPVSIDRNQVSTVDIIRAVAEDQQNKTPGPIIAARFHNSIADVVARVCEQLRTAETVALSGGVFQNALLLDRTIDSLHHKGFRVITHSRVPANDGGISLGQVAVAAAREATSTTSPARHRG
ncbi:carbamoyltransferase HypF [Amycolatopsis saalfeldensis]|uniref:Carbamoyltransferase n=1 Tax=Amycolatopsis saalfeldensis TaxID=394193 RepID=A0A1H8YC66_9PSEU|nr:carbamoyltransferase HypF [Amycolatopsis saalfeldensis]SEP49844.1 hydrogenase maturation protein HypF [Amycolatopsis saalfeldensis]